MPCLRGCDVRDSKKYNEISDSVKWITQLNQYVITIRCNFTSMILLDSKSNMVQIDVTLKFVFFNFWDNVHNHDSWELNVFVLPIVVFFILFFSYTQLLCTFYTLENAN